MLSVWMILLIFVTVEGQECIPCPDKCTCSWYRGLDCSGLGLTSVISGCENGTIEDVYFSDNNITIINWQDIPRLDGSYCRINLLNNKIVESRGTFATEECHFFSLDLSYNSLTTIPTDFFVAYGHLQFVHIILTQNSITEILPGAIKIYNSSNVYFNVYLSFNKVSYIHPGAFDLDATLFDLELQNNNIVSFSILSALRSVTNPPLPFTLDLSNNLIEDLQVEDVDEEYDYIYTRINLKLVNNSWNCDCSHKSVAFDNSTLRAILERSKCYQPTCSTPDVVRHVPVLSLSPDDFTCPPRPDSQINFTNIEISRGGTASLVCPVTFADPPITHYVWTFSPKLSATELGLFVAELWDVQFTQQTNANHIELANVQLEGVYECRAISSVGTLSVNIGVSFPQSQTNFTPSFSSESTTRKVATATVTTVPEPIFFDKVFFIVLSVMTVMLSAIFLTLFIVIVKYFSLLRSQKASGRNSDKVTNKGKQKSAYEVSYNVTVDDEDYCVPSQGLNNQATDFAELYMNFRSIEI